MKAKVPVNPWFEDDNQCPEHMVYCSSMEVDGNTVYCCYNNPVPHYWKVIEV